MIFLLADNQPVRSITPTTAAIMPSSDDNDGDDRSLSPSTQAPDG